MLSLLFSLTLSVLVQDFGLDPHVFQHPIDYAAVADYKKDAVFTISHGEAAPTRICIALYELEDTDFQVAKEQRCFEPEANTFITLYTWEGRNIKDLGNILVTIYHKNGRPTVMALAYRNS